ncbi:MAG: AlbA family DNA-binding domain-containing protein [Alphaproteobacteria bacterium]
MKNAIHWLYAALMWARYTAQTDQRLEHDISLVMKEDAPWNALRAQIIDQRGRIEVKASDFEGRGAQHPFFLATYMLEKAQGAIDWSNGMPLGHSVGTSYKIHGHHIFPQSVLYKNGYDAESHLDRKVVNEIANRAFLTADTNWTLAATLPEAYLPEVEKNYPGALAKQFIPLDTQIWRIDRYRDFLAARREIIAKRLNDYMNTLISEPEPTKNRPISELISLGESENLEFKSSIQWDVVKKEKNDYLRTQVTKTIAAFMNSQGGTLLIGVEDDGTILGLEPDLAIVGGSTDRLLQLLASIVSDTIGAEYGHLVKFRFEGINDKLVGVADVDHASEPAFVNGPKGREFYVRVVNTTRSLDPEAAIKYRESHWS